MVLTNFTNGTVANATEVNANFRKMALSSAYAAISTNLLKHDFTSDTAETKTNLTYDAVLNVYNGAISSAHTLETATGVLTSTDDILFSLNYGGKNVLANFDYVVCTVYDEIDDSSIDTDLWNVTANVVEDGDKMTITASNNTRSAETDDVNGVDWSTTSDTVLMQVDWDLDVNGTVFVELIDGSANTATAYTFVGSDDNEALVQLKFNTTGDVVAHVFDDAGATLSSVVLDTSGFDASGWRIKLRVVSSSGSQTGDIFYLRRITGSETSTVTTSISADDGDNYTEVNSDNMVTFGDATVQARGKMTVTTSATEVVAVGGAQLLIIPDNK